MSIIRSRDELAALMAEGQDEYFFYEQFVEGRHLQFGGVFGEDVDAAVTYETTERQGSFGPSSAIRLIDDPDLQLTGRAVVAALGITGMMNINVIRDADGRDWIHDVNPRVFGSFLASRPAGVDLMQAYIDWILSSSDRPEPGKMPWGVVRGDLGRDGSLRFLRRRLPSRAPSTGRVSSGASFVVFPGAFRADIDDQGGIRFFSRFLKAAVPYVRWIGPRYVAYETAWQLQIEARRVKKSILSKRRH
jgi:hypothetical protein